MGMQDDRLGELAVAFNQRLQRRDGESIADVLEGRLRHDVAAWLDDCLLPIFDDVASSKWPEGDRSKCEARCRREVASFHAAEAALVARDAGYVPENQAEWFVDWCQRLVVGADMAIEPALKPNLRHQEQDGVKRVAVFSKSLAAALPEPSFAHALPRSSSVFSIFRGSARESSAAFFVRLCARLLIFRAHASVSTAFHDPATAAEAQSILDVRDANLRSTMQHFITGGGVNYVITKNGALLTSPMGRQGSTLLLGARKEVLERGCGEIDDAALLTLSNRDVLARLPELKRLNVNSIAVVSAISPEGDQEAGLLPLDQFIGVVKRAVADADASELGAAYSKEIS
jgi:hypothetical protein